MLVDAYGKPIQTAALKEPQTARISRLEQELIQSQLDGITPAGAARILKDADGGDIKAQAQLFDDMMDRDAHLACEFGKRAMAVAGLEWTIQAPPEATPAEQESAQWLEQVLRWTVDDFEDLLLAAMDAPGYGYSAIEIEWTRDGSEWLPTFHPRPQTWLRLDRTRRELRLDDGGGEGLPLTPAGWIVHQPRKVKTGYLGRAGLLRTVLWPFLYKAYAIGDFAEFLEVYGLPIILGKYMEGSSQDQKTSLLRAVTSLGRDARAIMPETMQVEIQKVAGGQGSGSNHLDMVAWADSAQSRAILGQVLSSSAESTGLGSGVANLHAEVRRDILRSDARQLADTLTRDLLYPLLVLNRPGVDAWRRCPRFAFDDSQADDIGLFADALPKLAAGGARIPVSWVHERLRIPMAETDDDLFRPASAAPAPGADGAPPADRPPQQLTAVLAALKDPAQEEPARATAELLGAAAQPQVDAWLATIRAMLDGASSLEEFRERLLAAWPQLDRGRLTDLMRDGMVVSALSGMSDVDDETRDDDG